MMQIKIFTIPILGGDAINEEMNTFLRSKKVLHVESHLISNDKGTFWCYAIKYLEGQGSSKFPRKKIEDYRAILGEKAYQRFEEMRKIRKRIANENGVQAYVVLTNDEMAELAKVDKLTMENLKQVKGVSKNKLEKYGHHFILEAEPNKEKKTKGDKDETGKLFD